MTHLLELKEAVLVKIDVFEMQHALAVQATRSVQPGQGLKDLVGNFK